MKNKIQKTTALLSLFAISQVAFAENVYRLPINGVKADSNSVLQGGNGSSSGGGNGGQADDLAEVCESPHGPWKYVALTNPDGAKTYGGMYGTVWRTWTANNGYKGNVVLYNDEERPNRGPYEKGELKSSTLSEYGFYYNDYEVRLKQNERYQDCVDAGYFS